MKRASARRRSSLAGNPPLSTRVETVARLLPSTGEQVSSSWLVGRLWEKFRVPRRTALRWLRESLAYKPPEHHYPLVSAVRSGREVLYGLNLTGFMNPEQAKWFLGGATSGYLDAAPKLVAEYADSVESMGLFWEQASSSLVLSMNRLLAAAQSVTFAQVHQRARPSVAVARAQADVLTETFLRPWVQDLVATLHRFLEIEAERNRTTPRLPDGRLGAPSAMDGYNRGWAWADGPGGAAHKVWIESRGRGPWKSYLERVVREQEELSRRINEPARGGTEAGNAPPA
jgi:hypothetical protein